MAFDAIHMVRILKRLREAAGYMELGMPQQSLDRLEELGDLGPFEAEVLMLRGEAFKAQERFEDAAAAFQQAAVKFPEPHDRAAWMALSLCYQQAGDLDRAVQSLGLARGAKPAKAKRKQA